MLFCNKSPLLTNRTSLHPKQMLIGKNREFLNHYALHSHKMNSYCQPILGYHWQEIKTILNSLELENKCLSDLCNSLIMIPPSEAMGVSKDNGQNPDSGSKNIENQNNDAGS